MSVIDRPQTSGRPAAAAFLGDWLVSEYVYTPAGEYVGVVRQRRSLQQLAPATIRVIQQCEPVEAAARLSAAAEQVAAIMNQRTGEFVFDLQLVGRARRYLGPDVVGGGFAWRDGALTARGLWPRFGYNFTSFSILLNPERQVTGGKFFLATEPIATIVGAAGPATQGQPVMADLLSPSQLPSAGFHGHRYTIAPDGEPLATAVISGEMRPLYELDAAAGREKWYGPLREVEAVTGPGEILSLIEVNDPVGGAVAGLGKWFRDEQLSRVELYVLSAGSGSVS